MNPKVKHNIHDLQCKMAEAVHQKYQKDLYSLSACENDYDESQMQEDKLILGLLQSGVICKGKQHVPKVPILIGNQVDIDNFHNPSFTFVQAVATGVWLIRHNLNCNPQIQVRDVQGNSITGQVSYINSTLVQITFNTLIAGKAYLYQIP